MHEAYRIKERIIPATFEWSRTPLADRSAFCVPPSRTAVVDVPPVLSLIGNTPLVPLKQVRDALAPDVSLHVKLEGLNPGGSVKDRAALFIVREALRGGELAPGRTLLDATSGNTGIAYAMLGAALGFPVHLALPTDASPERVQILRAYGAQLTLTDPGAGTEGARQFVQERAAREPELYFHADQYNNPANPLAHYATTGPEIWRQTEGRVTHFVAGLGTAGTMMGTGRYLKERKPEVQLVGVQPKGPQHGISGLKHLATADPPGIYDPGLVDRIAAVGTGEAKAMASRLARQEGLFVGISAGAAVVAALRAARELEHGVVVALLADGGGKYTSAPFWGELGPGVGGELYGTTRPAPPTNAYPLTVVYDQHPRPVNLAALERQERPIRLLEREGLDGRLDGNLGGQLQQLLRVLPGEVGHAADAPLPVEQLIVVQLRDRRHSHASERHCAAAVEVPQCLRHDPAGRGENDAGVHLLRGRVLGTTDPDGAQFPCEPPVALAAGEDVGLAAPVARHLNGDVGRAAESVEP
jgi:cysteine synthase B